MLRRVPYLNHHEITRIVEAGRMSHHPVWPVALPAFRVDPELVVDCAVLLLCNALELQNQFSCHNVCLSQSVPVDLFFQPPRFVTVSPPVRLSWVASSRSATRQTSPAVEVTSAPPPPERGTLLATVFASCRRTQTRMISRPATSTYASSCVTSGQPWETALATIHDSLTDIRRPESRRITRNRADDSATDRSIGSGSSASARASVASLQSRVSMFAAANTPTWSSPTVMTEMADWARRSCSTRGRPASRASQTLVSATPRFTGGRRSYRTTAHAARRQGQVPPDGRRPDARTPFATSTVVGSRRARAPLPGGRQP